MTQDIQPQLLLGVTVLVRASDNTKRVLAAGEYVELTAEGEHRIVVNMHRPLKVGIDVVLQYKYPLPQRFRGKKEETKDVCNGAIVKISTPRQRRSVIYIRPHLDIPS